LPVAVEQIEQGACSARIVDALEGERHRPPAATGPAALIKERGRQCIVRTEAHEREHAEAHRFDARRLGVSHVIRD
jgi:hypothetical protein